MGETQWGAGKCSHGYRAILTDHTSVNICWGMQSEESREQITRTKWYHRCLVVQIGVNCSDIFCSVTNMGAPTKCFLQSPIHKKCFMDILMLPASWFICALSCFTEACKFPQMTFVVPYSLTCIEHNNFYAFLPCAKCKQFTNLYSFWNAATHSPKANTHQYLIQHCETLCFSMKRVFIKT